MTSGIVGGQVILSQEHLAALVAIIFQVLGVLQLMPLPGTAVGELFLAVTAVVQVF